MPVLKITTQDIAKGLNTPEGWHPCTITKYEIKAPKPGGKGINYILTFEVNDQDNKIHEVYFNSLMIFTLVPVLEAIQGKKVDPSKDLNLDFDALVGKKLDVDFRPEEYNGNIYNKPKNYAPLGYGTSGQPF